MQNFSDLVIVVQRNIFKFGVKWTRGEKNVKTGHISKTVRDTIKVTINH